MEPKPQMNPFSCSVFDLVFDENGDAILDRSLYSTECKTTTDNPDSYVVKQSQQFSEQCSTAAVPINPCCIQSHAVPGLANILDHPPCEEVEINATVLNSRENRRIQNRSSDEKNENRLLSRKSSGQLGGEKIRTCNTRKQLPPSAVLRNKDESSVRFQAVTYLPAKRTLRKIGKLSLSKSFLKSSVPILSAKTPSKGGAKILIVKKTSPSKPLSTDCSIQKKILQSRVCGETFTLEEHHKDHQIAHINTVQYRCEICNKTFVTSQFLKKHQLTHADDHVITCPLCKSIYPHKSAFQVHCETVHPDQSASELRSDLMISREGKVVYPSVPVIQTNTDVPIVDLEETETGALAHRNHPSLSQHEETDVVFLSNQKSINSGSSTFPDARNLKQTQNPPSESVIDKKSSSIIHDQDNRIHKDPHQKQSQEDPRALDRSQFRKDVDNQNSPVIEALLTSSSSPLRFLPTDVDRHFCSSCGSRFKDLTSLRQHILTHKPAS